MSDQVHSNPFHPGELEAQMRAGAGDVAKWAGGFIRDYLPEQHRDFHTSLPFFVISGSDLFGQTWATIIEGPEGFIRSLDARHITLATELNGADPLAEAFLEGADIGILGIELASRRRNRFSGFVRPGPDGYTIDIRQTFGNCPQYIRERAWSRINGSTPKTAKRTKALDASQIARIQAADTMFIGTGHQNGSGNASSGYDASHRGGEPGFVKVVDATHLQIPDYPGNNFFNTIGNLLSDPRIGLLFVDFETGGLLQLSGRARIDWNAGTSQDPGALRTIEVEIETVLDRPEAVGLRWARQDHLSYRLKVARRVEESSTITSFYLVPADGRPLDPFEAGQHLPIVLQIPGQTAASKRTYSLSGPPQLGDFYRLSVKREDKGLVSGFLHDTVQQGEVLEALVPSGNFVIPCGNCPLILVGAGVGITPLMSMLHATAGEERPVWLIHGARNGFEHALSAEVDELVARSRNIERRVFYSRPNDEDVQGQDYDAKGRVSADYLLGLNAGPDAHYMLCGPASFLADIRNGLETGGVPSERIHFETFGPAS